MMQQSQAVRRSGVVSLDRLGFARACTDLMAMVASEGRPDALVAIPTGGLHVADAMAQAMPGGIPILSLTCRRPTTQHKHNLAALKKLLAGLPRPIADRLRANGHVILDDGAGQISKTGVLLFRDLGIGILPDNGRRPLCRTCLDWSERRPHLAGRLGAALLHRLLELEWLTRAPTGRALVFTRGGEKRLSDYFDLSADWRMEQGGF